MADGVLVGASVCLPCEGSGYVGEAVCSLCLGLGSENIRTPQASGDPPALVRMALSLLAQGSGEQSPEYETFAVAITRAGHTLVDHGQVATADPGIRGGTSG